MYDQSYVDHWREEQVGSSLGPIDFMLLDDVAGAGDSVAESMGRRRFLFHGC